MSDSLISRTLGAGYAAAADVRRISGIPASDADDPTLDALAVDASVIFTDLLATRVEGQPLKVMDAAKTTFQGPAYLADLNVDKTVDAADITVRFERISPTGAYETSPTGTVTVTNSAQGIFTTANPLPDGYQAVVDCGYYSRPLDLTRAMRAVAFLAAHLAALRMRAPGRITRADTLGNVGASAQMGGGIAWMSQRTKYLDAFDREMAAIRGRAVF